MKKLKANYYAINISLSIILFSIVNIIPEKDMQFWGEFLAASIFLYAITGLFFTFFLKKCIVCSKTFLSSRNEICEKCYSKIKSKNKENSSYSIEYPYSFKEDFKDSKSKSPVTKSSPFSRFIE